MQKEELLPMRKERKLGLYLNYVELGEVASRFLHIS